MHSTEAIRQRSPFWLAGSVLLLIAFALGACGGDDEPDHEAEHD